MFLEVAWEALDSVFLNVAIRALGKKEAITELRRGSRVTVSFHGAQADTGPDYLNTRCPGPGEVDLTFARALPTGTFPVRSFKARSVTIRLSGQRTFVGGGFDGTASWNVTFSLVRATSSVA